MYLLEANELVVPESVKRDFIEKNINKAWDMGGVGGSKLWRETFRLQKKWFPLEKEYKGLCVERQIK